MGTVLADDVNPHVERRFPPPPQPAVAPDPPRRRELDTVGTELADCLRRFLAGTADEHTLRRAQEALSAWAALTGTGPEEGGASAR